MFDSNAYGGGRISADCGAFFARENIAAAGVASKVIAPLQFQKMSGEDNIQLAYELGRQALRDLPQADGLYIGGGAWLSQPVAEALEAEFGRPVITNVFRDDPECAYAAGFLDSDTGPRAAAGIGVDSRQNAMGASATN